MMRSRIRPALASPPPALHQDVLTADDGWDAALKGVDYVVHVASPLGGARYGQDALIAAAHCGSCGPRPPTGRSPW